MSQSDSEESKFRRFKLLVSAAVIALMIGVVAFPVWKVLRVQGEFLARTAEVEPLIEAVYLKYFESGKWPENLPPLTQAEESTLPEGWRYYSTDPNEPPLLDIRGPLHMRLEYAFRKDANLHSSGGWRATCEGSPVRHAFSEQIPMRPVRKR